MTPIPKKVRAEIEADPKYKFCALQGQHGHVCGGRITLEHALIFAGKQIQEKWAIISVCAAGQEVDQYQDAHTMNKDLNKWVALSQGTEEDFKRYPKAFPPYLSQRAKLNFRFGFYKPKFTLTPKQDINYPFPYYNKN